MKRTCVCCKKELLESCPSGIDIVSKGICCSCLKQILAESPKTAREILNSLGKPILLLDNRNRIRAANGMARRILGRPLPDIENCLPGDAMECIHARLPGGCGQTMHCQACALRRTLDETLVTGQGLENVPAYQDVYQQDGSVVRRYLFISTEKIVDFILLRIDEIKTLRTLQASHQPSSDSVVS